MNIQVVYHSTTGNTKKVAHAIAQTLQIEAQSINQVQLSSPVDLLFLGDGIYAGEPSGKMKRFITTLDPNQIKNVAVFFTCGAPQSIDRSLTKLLQEKNFNLIGEAFSCRGQAWFLMNRHHPDAKDLANASKFAQQTVASLKQQL